MHRDVKPGNLMLDGAGTVRVLDLGLARVIEAASVLGRDSEGALTRSGAYVGTVDYIAPEQADDPRSADHRADIYSLGCTLYFLLAGYPPFHGTTVLKRLIAHQERPAPSLLDARDEIPNALETVYQRMVAKRPADRPASMAEVVTLLEACRSSADEAKTARVALRGYAQRMVKRADGESRGKERDSSVFAPPSETNSLRIDPDLNFEDLVMDLRPEQKIVPLVEGQLPPRSARSADRAAPARRTSPALIAGGWAAGLIVAAFVLYRLILHAPSKPAVELASRSADSATVTPAPAKSAPAPPPPPDPIPKAEPGQPRETKPPPAPPTSPTKPPPEMPPPRPAATPGPARKSFRFSSSLEAMKVGHELWNKYRDDEAVAAFREAIRLRPSNAYDYNSVGRVLSDYGQLDEAIKVFQQGLRRDSSNTVLLNGLAWVLVTTPEVEKRDLNEALATALRAMEKDKSQPVRNTLALIEYERGEIDNAEATLRPSVTSPNRGTVYDLMVMVMILHREGQQRRGPVALRQGGR